jgi:hypothetical protein
MFSSDAFPFTYLLIMAQILPNILRLNVLIRDRLVAKQVRRRFMGDRKRPEINVLSEQSPTNVFFLFFKKKGKTMGNDSAIDIAKKISLTYAKTDLSEADTRHQIINVVLHDILAWPNSLVTCEESVNPGYADYVLKNEKGSAVLVIEAKKQGKYFELPKNIVNGDLHKLVRLKILLSDKEIGSAVLQVRQYCIDIGSDFAAITNGNVWIIFKWYQKGRNWKDSNAYVVTNLEYFHSEFIESQNLLNFSSVCKDLSLQKELGDLGTNIREKYYPKEFIYHYNSPVRNNKYYSFLKPLCNRFLENIPIENREFLDSCYVNTRDYSEIQNGVALLIYDALSPYFVNEGIRDISDDRRAGAFGKLITHNIKESRTQEFLILVGGRGCGKSTFIKKYLFSNPPPEIKHFAKVTVIDLLHCAQIENQLADEIWKSALALLDADGLLNNGRDKLIGLFDDKYQIFKKQFLEGLPENSVEYHRELSGFLDECKRDIKYCCERIKKYWANKAKGLVILLDNMDQLRPELQDVCFLTGKELSKRLDCLVIVSMREERYYRAKTAGVLDAYHNKGFHLSSPKPKKVFEKRILYMIRKIGESKNPEVELGIPDDAPIDRVLKFLSLCLREFRNGSAPLNQILSSSTQGDLRLALSFFREFLTSGYTNVDEMISTPYWNIAPHQIIKPVLIPNRYFYEEKLSEIPNIYQIRSEGNSSHFTSIRILKMLSERSAVGGEAAYIGVSFIVEYFSNTFSMKEDCIRSIDILLSKRLIEANNRLEHYSEQLDEVKVTAFGDFMINHLCFEFTYLDLVSLDCGLFDEALKNEFVQYASEEYELFKLERILDRLNHRLKRVDLFVEYLRREEERELGIYDLPRNDSGIALYIKDGFEIAKQRVMRSASRKKD